MWLFSLCAASTAATLRREVQEDALAPRHLLPLVMPLFAPQAAPFHVQPAALPVAPHTRANLQLVAEPLDRQASSDPPKNDGIPELPQNLTLLFQDFGPSVLSSVQEAVSARLLSQDGLPQLPELELPDLATARRLAREAKDNYALVSRVAAEKASAAAKAGATAAKAALAAKESGTYQGRNGWRYATLRLDKALRAREEADRAQAAAQAAERIAEAAWSLASRCATERLVERIEELSPRSFEEPTDLNVAEAWRKAAKLQKEALAADLTAADALKSATWAQEIHDGAWRVVAEAADEWVDAEEAWRKATEDANAAREAVASTKRQAKKKAMAAEGTAKMVNNRLKEGAEAWSRLEEARQVARELAEAADEALLVAEQLTKESEDAKSSAQEAEEASQGLLDLLDPTGFWDSQTQAKSRALAAEKEAAEARRVADVASSVYKLQKSAQRAEDKADSAARLAEDVAQEAEEARAAAEAAQMAGSAEAQTFFFEAMELIRKAEEAQHAAEESQLAAVKKIKEADTAWTSAADLAKLPLRDAYEDAQQQGDTIVTDAQKAYLEAQANASDALEAYQEAAKRGSEAIKLSTDAFTAFDSSRSSASVAGEAYAAAWGVAEERQKESVAARQAADAARREAEELSFQAGEDPTAIATRRAELLRGEVPKLEDTQDSGDDA